MTIFSSDNWRNKLQLAHVPHSASVRQAMEAINRTALQICFVCDGQSKVVGTVTDGDVRRALLAGLDLSSSVTAIMNRDFLYVTEDENHHNQAMAIMMEANVARLPVMRDGRVTDIILNSRFYERDPLDNIAIIMAGGVGARLRPLTENCPKPLLKIDGKPILEHIITHLKRHGIRRFYISINYLGHMIRDYFENGSAWDVEINYLEETQRLGTAGALTLLPHRPEDSFLVTNGDVIMQADLTALLKTHTEGGYLGTMCVRQYSVSVPYGVVHTDGRHITGLVEKPSYTYFINAGVYCLRPEALDLFPRESFFNMTDFFTALVEKGHKASTYLLDGPWVDVGSVEDYNYACQNLKVLGMF